MHGTYNIKKTLRLTGVFVRLLHVADGTCLFVPRYLIFPQSAVYLFPSSPLRSVHCCYRPARLPHFIPYFHSLSLILRYPPPSCTVSSPSSAVSQYSSPFTLSSLVLCFSPPVCSSSSSISHSPFAFCSCCSSITSCFSSFSSSSLSSLCFLLFSFWSSSFHWNTAGVILALIRTHKIDSGI